MFQEINRREAADIRMIIEENLSDILTSNGLKLDTGNAVYDGTSVRFTGLTVSLKDALAPGAQALEDHNAWLSKTLKRFYDTSKVATMSGGQRVTLVEYHTRKRKYPFIVEEVETGKRFKITEPSARRMFGVEVAA